MIQTKYKRSGSLRQVQCSNCQSYTDSDVYLCGNCAEAANPWTLTAVRKPVEGVIVQTKLHRGRLDPTALARGEVTPLRQLIYRKGAWYLPDGRTVLYVPRYWRRML